MVIIHRVNVVRWGFFDAIEGVVINLMYSLHKGDKAILCLLFA